MAEAELDVVLRLHSEGEAAALEVREALKSITEQLKDLQTQAKETNATLTEIAATSYISAAALSALERDGLKAKDSQTALNGATGQTNKGLWQQIQALPVLGGLITGLAGFFSILAIVLGVVAGVMLLFGPVVVQTAGYIVLTTAYLVGLTAVLTMFTAGLLATIIVAGSAALAFGAVSVAVVLLAEHLFQAGKIANDPLVGLGNAFGKMADTLGTKALPMAREIIAFLTSLVPTIQTAGMAILNWFGPNLSNMLEIAKSAVYELLQGFKQLGQFIGPLLTAIIGMKPLWDQLFQLLMHGGVAAIEWLLKEFIKLVIWFEANLPQILPVVKTVIGLIGQTLDGLGVNLDRLSQWFTQRMPAMGPIVGQVFSAMGTFIQNFGTAAGNLVDWFITNWPEIKKQADAVFKALKDGWDLVAPILVVLWPFALEAVGIVMEQLTQHSHALHDIIGLMAGGLALLLVILGILVIVFVAVAVGAATVYDWFVSLFVKLSDVKGIWETLTKIAQAFFNTAPGGTLAAWIDQFIKSLGTVLSLIGNIRSALGQGGGGSQPAAGQPGSQATGGVGGGGGFFAMGPVAGTGTTASLSAASGATQQINIYLDGQVVGGFVQKVQASSLSRLMTLT